MKKTAILSALFILIFSAAFSQEPDSLKVNVENKDNKENKDSHENKDDGEIQTLLGHNRPGGFYGAFSVGYSRVDNYQTVLLGGRFVWIEGHSFGFGFGGTGFINEFHYEPLLDREVALAGGYGGLYIEPILMPRYPVHLSFPVLFGAGGISYVSKEANNNNNLIEDSEAFLIVEPAAELELNLSRNFRFAISASYRFPTAFNVGTSPTTNISAESIKGWSYTVTFKFGKF